MIQSNEQRDKQINTLTNQHYISDIEVEYDKGCSYDYIDVYTAGEGLERICGSEETWSILSEREVLVSTLV